MPFDRGSVEAFPERHATFATAGPPGKQENPTESQAMATTAFEARTGPTFVHIKIVSQGADVLLVTISLAHAMRIVYATVGRSRRGGRVVTGITSYSPFTATSITSTGATTAFVESIEIVGRITHFSPVSYPYTLPEGRAAFTTGVASIIVV